MSYRNEPIEGRRLRVGTACSGAGLGLVALDQLFGEEGWEYIFASEYCPAARALHETLWDINKPKFHYHADAKPATTETYVDMFIASPRCQPYSLGCPQRDVMLPYALEEFERIMYYVYYRRPLLVIIETVAAILQPFNAAALARWNAVLHTCNGYKWYANKVCPSQMTRDCLRRRKRVYILGRRTTPT